LKYLSFASGLSRLCISGVDELTDEGLKHLTFATGLNALDLNSCSKISTEGIKYLRFATRLKTLEMDLVQTRGEAVNELRLATQLESLGFSYSRVGHLHGLPFETLTWLDVQGCKIEDEGFNLGWFGPKLRYLDISTNYLANEAVRKLTVATSLLTLHMSFNPPITDIGCLCSPVVCQKAVFGQS